MANDQPNEKPTIYSWTEKQIVDIKDQLVKLDQRLKEMEQVANLQWLYGIGFAVVAIGLGFLAGRQTTLGWIVVGAGLLWIIIILLAYACRKKGKL